MLLWQLEAPLWEWAIASMLLGLGFTFFSGAVEAWLVDALAATGFTGEISVLALPFLALSRRQNAPADTLDVSDLQAAPQPASG